MKLLNYLCLGVMLSLPNVTLATNTSSLLSAIAQKKMDKLVALVTAIEQGIVQLTLRNCTDIKKFLGLTYEQLTENNTPDITSITVDIHSGSQIETYNFTSDLATKLLASPLYKKDLPLVVFTPGFLATRKSPIMRTMASRLAATGLYNVLAVDPSKVIGWFYFYSATTVRFIGEALGSLLADFYNEGVTSYHAIGHSLGAHISGFAGKTFYNLTGTKLDRITGLDPAGPCFFDEKESLKLNSKDGNFVDVIHSDSGTFGITEPCGHVDFYPNGGNAQPNCLAFMCSHNKSWEFFSESITYPKNFPAVQCTSWNTFKTGVCSSNPREYMGYATPSNARGIYYLKTNAVPLYGMGERGITTSDSIDLATSIQLWWNNFLGSLG